ncbi:MAG: STAS domain-containing protein [Magnetospirillum gryphiswaldense]|nr:STAS domain-containing protein [Magnetospirillum gryphiswaldense]
MEVNVVRSAGAVRFSLKGTMSFRDKDNFNPILEALADKAGLNVVVDLAGLDHVDSFGIGLFLLANEQAAGGNRLFRLVNPHGSVARVFELANLDAVLNLQKDTSSRHAAAAPARGGICFHRYPTSADGGETCVSLSGRLVFAEHESFEEIISSMAQSTGKTVVLDLEGLDFMDSAGLSMIMIAREEAEGRGQTLKLRNARGAVRQLLDLSALDFMLEG